MTNIYSSDALSGEVALVTGRHVASVRLSLKRWLVLARL